MAGKEGFSHAAAAVFLSRIDLSRLISLGSRERG